MNWHRAEKIKEEPKFKDLVAFGEDPLLQALRTIKTECEKYNRCAKCPLRTYDGKCAVTIHQPHNWKLAADEEPKPPRLFA